MRSSELREIERQRAAERTSPRPRRTDDFPARGWNPRSLRAEIETEFREQGARVFQEETSR